MGSSGPSMGAVEASSRRVMNEQMAIANEQQIAAEQREREREAEAAAAEQVRREKAAQEEANKLKKREMLESATTEEILGGIKKTNQPTTPGLSTNLDAPTIQRPDYEANSGNTF